MEQNCDGLSDYDQDGNGVDSNQHGGDDCDDTDAALGSILLDSDCNGVIVPLFNLESNGVTVTCPNANVGDTGVINGVSYTKQDRTGIESLLQSNPSLLETTCTSGITDMSSLLSNKTNFNTDISSWDTSNVTNMDEMFHNASTFNQDLSSWCV